MRRGSRVPYLLSACWASGINFLGAVGGLGRGGHDWHRVHGSQAGWRACAEGSRPCPCCGRLWSGLLMLSLLVAIAAFFPSRCVAPGSTMSVSGQYQPVLI